MAEELGLGTLGVIGISFVFNFGRFLAHIIYRIWQVIKKCLLKNAEKDKVVSINPEIELTEVREPPRLPVQPLDH